MKALAFLLLFFSVTLTHARVCQTRGTSLFAVENTQCLSLSRRTSSGEEFQLKALFAPAASDSIHQPTLVFIPGGPGISGSDFFLSLERRSFPGSFHRHLNVNLVFYDPRGTGASRFPGDLTTHDHRSLSTEINVDDLLVLLENLPSTGPVILLAHSAGGAIALRAAERAPEKVQGLILYSAISSLKDMGQTKNEFEGRHFRLWREALNGAITSDEVQDFEQRYALIEEQAIAQQANLILGEEVEPRVAPEGIFAFRQASLSAALQGRETFEEFLVEHRSRVLAAGMQQPLRPLRLSDILSPLLSPSYFVRLVLSCGEAMTFDEGQQPHFYPGLQRADLCQSFAVGAVTAVEPHLEQITQPALVLTGRHDVQVPFFWQEQMASRLPASQVRQVSEGGHTWHESHPVEFFRAIQDFLAGVDSSL